MTNPETTAQEAARLGEQIKALESIARHAKIAADNIVEFSNNKPGGMCGWLDDACTHADIAADLAKKLASALAAPVPPAQEDADIRRVRQQLEQEWCALRAMKLAYKATPSPAPQSAEVLAQAGGAAIRCRKMADEVLAALEHGGHGWDEDQIDEVQSKLLPDVYDLLNLLAVASPSAREPAQPVTALWLVQEAVNLCAAGDIDENTDDGLGWGGFVADAKKLLALKDDPVPTVDYLNGHQHGLEWAARMVKADDPRTGDWLHDDRNDLAEAICKGPEMPDAAQPPSPERGEAASPVGVADEDAIGAACYRGNTVSFMYDRAKAYGDEIMRTWHAIKDAGLHPGRTDERLSDCVKRLLASTTPKGST